MEKITNTFTYTKLRSGDWGVKVMVAQDSMLVVGAGNSVPVTKKSGETKLEKLARRIWLSDDRKTAIFAIARHAESSAGRGRRQPGYESDYVRCRWCGQKTRAGDDWCDCCGRANYE
jgi:hypothetical protein